MGSLCHWSGCTTNYCYCEAAQLLGSGTVSWSQHSELCHLGFSAQVSSGLGVRPIECAYVTLGHERGSEDFAHVHYCLMHPAHVLRLTYSQ